LSFGGDVHYEAAHANNDFLTDRVSGCEASDRLGNYSAEYRKIVWRKHRVTHCLSSFQGYVATAVFLRDGGSVGRDAIFSLKTADILERPERNWKMLPCDEQRHPALLSGAFTKINRRVSAMTETASVLRCVASCAEVSLA
jgi:hypothetical protein